MAEETLEQYKKRIARSGGLARAQNLTKKERSDSARKAAEARWKDALVNLEKKIAARKPGRHKEKKSPPPQE